MLIQEGVVRRKTEMEQIIETDKKEHLTEDLLFTKDESTQEIN